MLTCLTISLPGYCRYLITCQPVIQQPLLPEKAFGENDIISLLSFIVVPSVHCTGKGHACVVNIAGIAYSIQQLESKRTIEYVLTSCTMKSTLIESISQQTQTNRYLHLLVCVHAYHAKKSYEQSPLDKITKPGNSFQCIRSGKRRKLGWVSFHNRLIIFVLCSNSMKRMELSGQNVFLGLYSNVC